MVLRACLIRHAHNGENRNRSVGIASDGLSRGPLGCRWSASAGIRVLDRNKRLISKGKHERLALANLPSGGREVRAPGLEPGFRRWQRPVITTTLRSLVMPPTEQGFKRLSAGGIGTFRAAIIPYQSGHRCDRQSHRCAS